MEQRDAERRNDDPLAKCLETDPHDAVNQLEHQAVRRDAERQAVRHDAERQAVRLRCDAERQAIRRDAERQVARRDPERQAVRRDAERQARRDVKCQAARRDAEHQAERDAECQADAERQAVRLRRRDDTSRTEHRDRGCLNSDRKDRERLSSERQALEQRDDLGPLDARSQGLKELTPDIQDVATSVRALSEERIDDNLSHIELLGEFSEGEDLKTLHPSVDLQKLMRFLRKSFLIILCLLLLVHRLQNLR
ncbi:octapeptide-repeat protein T2-like [Palaemon carinicauda]|uniref:octapeptide-repeat protein T2-like n=1 Tax=Palaemon carinicauda TaxID=392227 RepID=UPI0035B68DA9